MNTAAIAAAANAYERDFLSIFGNYKGGRLNSAPDFGGEILGERAHNQTEKSPRRQFNFAGTQLSDNRFAAGKNPDEYFPFFRSATSGVEEIVPRC